MYGSRNWHNDPVLWIPTSILWCAFEMIASHFDIAGKISRKRPENKNIVEKIIHIVCFIVAVIVVSFIAVAINLITGIDLLDNG